MPARPDDSRPPLGFLVVRIAEAVDRAFVEALSGLGLKARELRMLVLIDREPGLNQRRLARQLGVDAGNLVAVLDSLERDGILARARDPVDRRQRLVSLTARGDRLLERALRATEEAEERIFGSLSAGDRSRYYEATLKIYGAL